MARVPGTEAPVNQAGWTPGAVVRCRRSRANGRLDLADRRGLVTEVRPQHVRVLLEPSGHSVWLESEAVLPEDVLPDARLELLRRALLALGGRRLEVEDGEVVIFGEEFPAAAVDIVREALGERLLHYAIGPHGVHEVASRIRLAPDA